MLYQSIQFFKNLNERQTLLLFVGVTFALRLYAVLMAQGIANDSVAYGFMARDFLRGNFSKGFTSPAPPFYPFLIYLFSADSSSIELTGRFISLFFGTFTIIPLYYLVKETIGPKEALCSALFYTFHPYLVTFSGMLLTESTYWGLLVLSVYFFWKGLKKEEILGIIWSGIFLGLSYLTRPEGVGYILVYSIWVILNRGVPKRLFCKFLHIGILILTVSFFVIPYMISIHRETGQWLISKKAIDTQSQFLKRDKENIDAQENFKKDSMIKKNSIIINLMRNVFKFFPFVTYYYFRAYHYSLWLFLFFGLIRTRKRVVDYELFIASLILFHLLSLSTFIPSTIRLSVPVIPLSLFWAGTGVIEIKKYLERTKIPNSEKVVTLLVLLMILVQLPQGLKPERRHRAEQKRVGEWLKKNTPSDAIIMSNSPQEIFYADRELVMMPPGIPIRGIPSRSYSEIIDYAKKNGVRYILVNKNTQEMNPDFVKSIHPKDLKEIFRKEDQGVIIYEVVD